MLTRYPDQARTRKGFALVGFIFLCFGVVMCFVGSVFGAIIGLVIGNILVVPCFTFSHLAFVKYKKALSWRGTFGSL